MAKGDRSGDSRWKRLAFTAVSLALKPRMIGRELSVSSISSLLSSITFSCHTCNMLRRLGSTDEAAKSYLRAPELGRNDRERRFLEKRMREVERTAV
jgi:predicted RNA polymerase sigma factor